MRRTRAFVTVVASTSVATANPEQRVLWYEIQQAGQQAILAKPAPFFETALAGTDAKARPTSTVKDASQPNSTGCPHSDATTLLTTTFAPEVRAHPLKVSTTTLSSLSTNSSAQLLAGHQPTVDAAADAELQDEGAAGPVAKASLFPLVIGLAAAVMML